MFWFFISEVDKHLCILPSVMFVACCS